MKRIIPDTTLHQIIILVQRVTMITSRAKRLQNAARHALRLRAVRKQTRILKGSRNTLLRNDQIALSLLGRNIRYYLPVFFEHYRRMGIERFVYLDNGSSDGSDEWVASQPNTIVARCELNFREYQRYLRYSCVRDFYNGGWRLSVDADELLDYPNSEHIDIHELIRRLSGRGHTSVVAQMLEMVPHGKLETFKNEEFENAIISFNKYSLAHIRRYEYYSKSLPISYFLGQNILSSNNIEIMYGGIRAELFGENCNLTKHFLFRDDPKVTPFPHPHVSCGLYISDFTAVLRHYKFAGNYLERERKLELEGRLSHSEGRLRLEVFDTSDVIFDLPNLRTDPKPSDLLNEGFLVASEGAQRMLSL